MNINIKHKYVDIATDGGHHFYGGSQLLFDGMIKRCGCSLIATADAVLYLTGCRKSISVDSYKQYVSRLAPAFPLIPYKGIPGVVLSLYLNIYLRLRRLPFRAHFSGLSLITGSLNSDMPVILCIGPGVHQFFKPKSQRGVMLYSLTAENALTPVKRVRSHFVVITAADGDLLTVSSWGTKYYIRLSELRRYATLDLCSIFTNVITFHLTKSVITRS